MSLNYKPTTSKERKQLFIETLLNATDAVSKVSEDSILSGIAEGVSKIASKAEKDIAISIAQMFPSTAFGSALDVCAQNFGVSPRFGAIGSSTYIKVSAAPGTQYLANTHQFKSTSGIQFNLVKDFTTSNFGFDYVPVQSVQTGLSSNVDPLTITTVTPAPTGHLNVVNEYRATGGQDNETDELFRTRIKNGANILARGTLSMLEQVFMNINSKVLKIFYNGHDNNGKLWISIQTQNGSSLTDNELSDLLNGSAQYFTLTELQPYGSQYMGISLTNVTYGFVDMSFRVHLDSSYDPDDVRKRIQVQVSKYLDPRFFDPTTQNVEWDNLLDIVKFTKGVLYVPDQYFYPRNDLAFRGSIVPRLRSFLMLDLNGAIIGDYQGALSPQFYPSIIDAGYSSTILNF